MACGNQRSITKLVMSSKHPSSLVIMERRRVAADVALKLTRPFNSNFCPRIPAYPIINVAIGAITRYIMHCQRKDLPPIRGVHSLSRAQFRITLFKELSTLNKSTIFFEPGGCLHQYLSCWVDLIQNPVWENPATVSFQRAKIRHSTSTGAREQRGARRRRRRRVIPHNHRLRRRRRRRVRVVRHVDERSSEN